MKTKIIFIGIILLAIPFGVGAVTLGQQVNFFIDPTHDLEKRERITATLQKIDKHLYFYIEDAWWNGLSPTARDEVHQALVGLSLEFEGRIYPSLTYIFGSEPKPGIDRDERITILVHQMTEGVGGYFNTGDGYSRLKSPRSNEREMLYLNALYLTAKPRFINGILAHEFMHLITFNQKDILRKVSEEIWLNDIRAEFVITWLGYNDEYRGSHLERRVRNFLINPQDSLTEWLNKIADYGITNLFAHYLVDHYGLKILVDSLHSSKVGIPSIDEALAKNGFKENFSQIFNDWAIAVLVNDCNFGPRYCYKNPSLKNLRVSPLLNFLPLVGESTLSITHRTTYWAGNWQRIVGGRGNLILEFDGANEVRFAVPYLICDYQGKCSIDFLTLDKHQKGRIIIPEFNIKYTSLTIIPSIQSKPLGFNGPERGHLFFWKASIVERTPEEEAELVRQLLAQIEFLKQEIARVQAEINTILARRHGLAGHPAGTWPGACQKFENNLYFGMRNNAEVRCLQEFLKNQGREIYPQALITGNFLSLTRYAVIRFQEKYASEILAPLGLKNGTGFVGSATRAKLNQLLTK